MACVYKHKKQLNDEVFYIGIGKNISRAYCSNRRNIFWKNIYSKYEIKIDIIYDDLTWESAKNIEIFLIKLYGRRDLKEGTLCNLTDGGEGSLNRKQSLETRLKIAAANKGRKHINRKNYFNYSYGIKLNMSMFID